MKEIKFYIRDCDKKSNRSKNVKENHTFKEMLIVSSNKKLPKEGNQTTPKKLHSIFSSTHF